MGYSENMSQDKRRKNKRKGIRKEVKMIAGNFNKYFIKKWLFGWKKNKHRIIHSVNEQMFEQAYPKRRNISVP